MVYSIPALIERGYPDPQYLPLSTRERSRPMHDLAVEIVVVPHDFGMHRMDLDNVVRIRHTVVRREFVRRQIANESHETSGVCARLRGTGRDGLTCGSGAGRLHCLGKGQLDHLVPRDV